MPREHTTNKSWQALAERRGFDPEATELDLLDLELELNLFRALSPTQALGAGLVVYAEGRDMAAQALNSIEFFRNESCGKCVPCRLGAQKMASLADEFARGADLARALGERVGAAYFRNGKGDRDGFDLRVGPLGAGALALGDQLLR